MIEHPEREDADSKASMITKIPFFISDSLLGFVTVVNLILVTVFYFYIPVSTLSRATYPVDKVGSVLFELQPSNQTTG